MATGVPSSQRSGVVSQSTFYELLKHVERRVGVLERSSRLRSASIGEGGIRVYGGGDIRIEDSGSLTVEDSAGNTEAAIGQGKAVFFDDGNQTIALGEFLAEFWNGSETVTHDVRGLGLFSTEDASIPYFFVGQDLEPEPSEATRPRYLQLGTYNNDPDVEADFVAIIGNAIDLQSNGTAYLFINTDLVRIGVTGADDEFQIDGLKITGNSPNLSLDAGTGFVRRMVSSARYKENVEDVVIDPDDVLQMVGKTFTVIGDPSGTRFTGFIAEELDALPTLGQFVNYDDQGRPDSVNYDRLALPVLELVKHLKLLIDTISLRVDVLSAAVQAHQDQQAQIDALTAQNTAQQEMIDQLAARMESVEAAQLQPATYTAPSGHAIKTVTVNGDGTLDIETIKVGGLL